MPLKSAPLASESSALVRRSTWPEPAARVSRRIHPQRNDDLADVGLGVEADLMLALQVIAADAKQRDARELGGQLLEQRREHFGNRPGRLERLEPSEELLEEPDRDRRIARDDGGQTGCAVWPAAPE